MCTYYNNGQPYELEEDKMKNIVFLSKKNLVKKMTLITSLFFALILISSSSISISFKNTSNPKPHFTEIKEEISNGLALRNSNNMKPTITKNNNIDLFFTNPLEDTMYGYNAYDPSGQLLEGTVNFCLDDPEAIQQILPTESNDFIAGATYTACDGRWLGCEYGSGKIWEIDVDTGKMILVGGGGENLNSLAWDPNNNKCYGSGDDNYLYEVDTENGEQEQIGPFGNNVEYMIGMAFHCDGTLYGWDLGNDKLWTIDTDTGAATEVASLGVDLNYAQDGAFDWETCILWLTAYSTTGFLAYWDFVAEELVVIDNFQGGAQITGSIFVNPWICAQRDIALKSIDSPKTGPAASDMNMQLTVHNRGYETETFDAQMEIIEYQSGLLLMEEDFTGTFPPEGWITDSWTQCNSNCCHESPCACLFSNNQILPLSTRNITSKAVDASENKTCKLSFYFEANMQYSHYYSFFIKFRKNVSSPWKYITPWKNPLDGNIKCKYYEVYISSSSDGCGEALQIQFEYFGNDYFNYFCIDNISLEGIDEYVEYTEVVEDIILDPGYQIQIDFPTWTPTQWQDPGYENTWVDFQVNAFTMLEEDEFPKNDNKDKLIKLYFGFFHDVGAINVSSPTSGPAQSFPVKGVIKNFGQYDECCFNTYVEITEIDIDNPVELLSQDFSDTTFPPTGWTKTHDNWMYSNTKDAGGAFGEAKFSYYPSSTDLFRLYTPLIDTSDCEVVGIEFKHSVYHHKSPYTLQVETSSDGVNWDVVWYMNPMYSLGSETESIITNRNVGSAIYVSWTFNGNSGNIYNWYVDDIEINGYSLLESEYLDYKCTMGIDSGEKQILEFDEWTPEFLAEETTGIKKYMVKAWTKMEEPEDENPDNDLFTKNIVLDFFHDIGIDDITSPSYDFNGKDYILWDNGLPDGRDCLPSSIYNGHSNIIIDDFKNYDNSWDIYGGEFRFIWDSGYGPGNMETVKVYFFQETENCEPAKDEYYALDVTSFYEYATGDYYFGRPEIICEFELDQVYLPPGGWYLGFQPDGIIDDIAYLLTAESKGCMVMADLPYWDYPRWTSSMSIWGEEYDLSWQLHYYFGQGPIVWIQPGNEDINVIVNNDGTFPEMDLICYAVIYEYITNPKIGTLVYEDNITNINLEEPLGGKKDLEFNDYNFSIEGKYQLILNIPNENDDYPNNNRDKLRVYADSTPPCTNHNLEPKNPDGDNGWYVNNIQVTLDAYDPESNNVSSGVKEIRYTINGGVEQVFPGWQGGSFVLTEDDKDIVVEYWAVDNAGNVETKKSFVINLDQTKPDIDAEWKINKKVSSWNVKFICYASDITSGMDKVEMYIDNQLYETSTGPTYEFIIKWSSELKNSQFKFVAYDLAGNLNFTLINGNVINSRPHVKSSYNQHLINLVYLWLLERFQYAFPILRYFHLL